MRKTLVASNKITEDENKIFIKYSASVFSALKLTSFPVEN